MATCANVTGGRPPGMDSTAPPEGIDELRFKKPCSCGGFKRPVPTRNRGRAVNHCDNLPLPKTCAFASQAAQYS